MPELPEVETTRRGIERHITGKKIVAVEVREPRLRYRIPGEFATQLMQQRITTVTRRGKYLLLHGKRGALLIHLGMSGSLSICSGTEKPGKHDHADLIFTGKTILRYRDPRRFGLMIWIEGDPYQHALLKTLGPEPLGDEFNRTFLYDITRRRRVAIKLLLMDSHCVVGVGNIYANEALFKAAILPTKSASELTQPQCQRLVNEIKWVLSAAITAGGTTLKDFTNSEGKPGYFKQALAVYGRANEPCHLCGSPITLIKLGQRATYYCVHCQR